MTWSRADLARRTATASAVWLGTVALLVPLVVLASTSVLAAAAATAAAVMVLLVVVLDLRRAGALVVTLAMFLAPMNDLRLGESYVTVSDAVFVIGFALLVPSVLGNRIAIPSAFLLGLAVLLVMGTVASAAAPQPLVSLNQVLRLLVGAFMLPVFFMVWRPAVPLVVRFASAYVLGASTSVLWGLVQGPVAGDARYIGLTYHPNYLGLACLLAASLVPYLTVMVARDRRWVFWVAGLVNAYGIWISGSRAALIVVVMLILVYPFVERSARAVGAVLLGIAGLLAFSGTLLQEDGNSALGRLFGNGTASGSDTERRNVLSAAWDQFLQHPLLGNGFDGGIGSHNIYLQVAVALGVIGLIGYVSVLWSALRPLFWTGPGHRLAYPVLAYAAIGPLTNTLWERLIWAVLALAFVSGARRAVDARGSREHEPVTHARERR